MRVLFLMPRAAWPPQTGLMLRNYHLARALARLAEVSYLYFDEDRVPVGPEQERELPPAPEAWCADHVTVPRAAGYTPGKLLRGAWGPQPVTVLNYTTPAMQRALAQLLERKRFDLVQVETSTLGAYLSVMRAARHSPAAVCDWHNIDSELMHRYADKAPLARRLYARLTARRIADFERWTLAHYDGHIACSERDAQQLRAVVPAARVAVIENGVDVEYYTDDKLARAHEIYLQAGAARRPRAATRVLYVGSMDYHANIDAVTEFARRDWPELHRQRPELTFTVVGRKPAPEVQALAALPGVEVTGTVPDVRPYYREAAAQIVPLRVGSGSRLKILEAMAAGVPVVSTRLGAEGLDVTDGLNLALADDAATMAGALFGLLDNAAQRRQMIDAARVLVREKYDWAALGTALGRAHASLLEARK